MIIIRGSLKICIASSPDDSLLACEDIKMSISSCVVVKCLSLCREGLVWVDINWMDNGECLDLIEKVCHEEL